jgi:hypothetical protein
MKKILVMLYLSIIAVHVHAMQHVQPWTWLYQKVFSPQELTSEKNERVVSFAKENVQPFTQLVFTWNAQRPQNGFFSFWVQSHNAHTKKWSEWYKMFEWGEDVQKSFVGGRKDGTRYCHVRFETSQDKADGFRIKIIAHEGIPLTLLKAVFVSASDFTLFTEESVNKALAQLPTVMIDTVPKTSQFTINHHKNGSMCSPTSCSMLVGYLLGRSLDPLEFAHKSFDHGLNVYGSWPFNMAHAYEQSGGTCLFATARLNSFYGLYQRLQKGIPVVVSVRGYIEGAPKVYENGHLLLVIGWDAQNQCVVCHDPAVKHDEGVLICYPIKSFLHAWERSHRLAYLAEPLIK